MPLCHAAPCDRNIKTLTTLQNTSRILEGQRLFKAPDTEQLRVWHNRPCQRPFLRRCMEVKHSRSCRGRRQAMLSGAVPQSKEHPTTQEQQTKENWKEAHGQRDCPYL